MGTTKGHYQGRPQAGTERMKYKFRVGAAGGL